MKDIYESPLNSRYSSKEMKAIFSPDHKFKTWRQLWIYLASCEKELGLNITDEQIAELEASKEDINYDVAAREEKLVRHDILLMREALILTRKRLLAVIEKLAKFADEYKAMPTLGFTHFQPAQLVTVGKRATLWLQDLLIDLDELDYTLSCLKPLGCKGTTGTQASFLDLFQGDHEKVEKLDKMIAEKMGFESSISVSGQTYTRKLDAKVLNTLSGIATSAHKFSNDIRLLQHLKEIEEPFEKTQIGSSAMAYKRNPMRSERICSLSRYVIANALNPAMTASEQWFERTLDDSANKRISVPEAFLAVDAILSIYLNVASGLVVYPKMIHNHIMNELPFMATENIMMEAVKRGGDRQELHEKIRVHSMAAGKVVKEEGLPNDLLSRIADDPAFGLDKDSLDTLLDPKLYIGRCPEQVTSFLKNDVEPILKMYASELDMEEPELNV